MGNEMGNNNTSEFREEDNRGPETEGKTQEPGHSNNVLKEENHVAVLKPDDQSKDYHEKGTELASDDSKAEEDNRSLETVTELESADAKAAAAAAELDTNKKDEEEENMVNTTSVAIVLAHDPECEHYAEHDSTQVEIGQSEQENTNSPKEIEEIGSLVDISESNVDFNAKQKSHESDNNSEDPAESIDCLVNEAESQEDTRLSDEQLLQVGNENAKAKIETKNDGEMDSNGTNLFDSQEEVDTDDSLCSDVDVSMPVDKCIILTEESKSIAKESENGDSNHDADESDSEVGEATNSLTGPDCKNDENGDPTIAAHVASSNENLQVERIKATEESCNQNKASEELLRESEAKFMMVNWHESLAATPNGNEKGYSESVSTEGRSALVPELVDLTTNLSITNDTYIKKESENYESVEEEPENEQNFEIEAKTEAPVLGEVYNPCFNAYVLDSVDEQQKITMECEDAEVCEESISEVKLGSSSELLGAVASPFAATNTSIEALVSAVELPNKKHEEVEAEAVLLDDSEIAEIPTETNSSASEDHSSEQLQKLKSTISESRDGAEAQEDVTSLSNGLVPKSSTAIEKTQLNEIVTEAEFSASGCSELLGKVASPFEITNTSMETLVHAVELPIEKLEEAEAEADAALLNASEIAEKLTETNSSASENHSSEQHQEFKSTMYENRDVIEAQGDVTSARNGLVPESSIEKTQLIETVRGAQLSASGSAEQSNERTEKVETSMSERVVNEEQKSMGTFSIESNPDSFNALTEMRKSPSFGIESSSELLRAVVSPFHVTNNSMETLIAEVELPIEKHEEAEARAVLHDASEITKSLRETKSLASENHSTEQHQELKSTISVSRDGVEAQEDVTSARNVLVPESLATVEKTQLNETVIEADLPASGSAERSNEQSERVETSMSERVGNEEHESTGRFSIESIPDSFNACAEMRKSPSFGIDLRIEARNEESDHTPLLQQNMKTNEDDVTLQTSLQQLLKDQPLPPEEKLITTLERSDSEKSRTPLFEQQDSAEKDSTKPKKSPSSSKSKEKHKRKSSLFTNCMCCTTVMN